MAVTLREAVLPSTLARMFSDPLQAFFLNGFLISTPIAAFMVFYLGQGVNEPEKSRSFWVGGKPYLLLN
jgi:hypothetical protein